MQTRYALQGIGQKLLPLISSVIEFIGKIIFVFVFIPQFQYMAVIFIRRSDKITKNKNIEKKKTTTFRSYS